MKRMVIGVVMLALALTGCQARVLQPARAYQIAAGHPQVAQWLMAHSAPGVLRGLEAKDTRRWRNYRPAMTVDRVKEGLQVRLRSTLGPAPHRMEILLHQQSGSILAISTKQ